MNLEDQNLIREVLFYITQNKSIAEICRILDINQEELLKILKIIKRHNYELGAYQFADDLILDVDNTALMVSIDHNDENHIVLGVISDTHIGNINDSVPAIHAAYEEFLKRGIKTVIHLGDIIEGDHTSLAQRYADSYEQLSILIKQYPQTHEINTILLLGNHDYHCIKYNQTDIRELIEQARPDLKTLGYGIGILSIADDYIYLKHKIPSFVSPMFPFNQEGKLLLSGHSHSFKIEGNRVRKIKVPSLSHLSFDLSINNPSFLILSIALTNNKLVFCEIEKWIVSGQSKEMIDIIPLSFIGGAFGCKTQEQLALKREKKQNAYLQA